MNSVLINMNVIQCLLPKVFSGETDGEHPLNHKIKDTTCKDVRELQSKETTEDG